LASFSPQKQFNPSGIPFLEKVEACIVVDLLRVKRFYNRFTFLFTGFVLSCQEKAVY